MSLANSKWSLYRPDLNKNQNVILIIILELFYKFKRKKVWNM